MLTPLLRILATAILTLSIPAYADPVVMTPLSVAIQSQPDDRLAAFVDASLSDVAVVLQNHAILTTSQSPDLRIARTVRRIHRNRFH